MNTVVAWRMNESLDRNKKLTGWWFVGKRKVMRRRSLEVKKNIQEEKRTLDRMGSDLVSAAVEVAGH